MAEKDKEISKQHEKIEDKDRQVEKLKQEILELQSKLDIEDMYDILR